MYMTIRKLKTQTVEEIISHLIFKFKKKNLNAHLNMNKAKQKFWVYKYDLKGTKES